MRRRNELAATLLMVPAVLNGGRSFSSGDVPGLKTRPPILVAQTPKATVASLLAAYDSGQYDVIDRTLAAQPKAPLANALQNDGDRWIKTGPGSALNRRRMVAASLALEIVGAGLVEEWKDIHLAIEWACEHVRRTPSDSSAELWWHLGSIALLHDGAGATSTNVYARDHIARHSTERFPRSDRIRLGKAIDAGRSVGVPERRLGMPEVSPEASLRQRSLTADLVEVYTALATSPEVGEEARLHLGALWLRVGSVDKALGVLAPLGQSSDRFIAHVSGFLVGEGLRRQGRYGDAAAAYRHALKITPGAMSASLGLSAALVAAGDMDTAIAAVAPAATTKAPVDPWRIFAFGDARHWPHRRQALREAMRK